MRQDQNDKAHGFMVQGKAQDDKNRIYISCARVRMTKKESTYAAQEAGSGKKAKKKDK